MFFRERKGTQRRCNRRGQDDAETCGKAFHDFNANSIGVNELQIRQIIGIIENPHAEGAAEES